MDGNGSKWTVIWLKVDFLLDESKGRSGRSKSVKVDGPEVTNWTVLKCQTGRSESVKVDGPQIFRTLSAP